MAQRLSIRYVENAGKAQWALDANAPLPAPMRAAADFGRKPAPFLPGIPAPPTYNAPAGTAQFAAPTATVVADGGFPGGRRVTVALHGSPSAAAMSIVIPKSAKLRALGIHGQHLAPPQDYDGDVFLACVSRDCAQEVVAIETASRAGFKLRFAEQRAGLPPAGAKLVAARPKQAIPSQNGDVTLLVNTLDIPAR
jgi:hypothetical protein